MADILIKNMTKPKNCVLEEHLSDGSIVKHEVIELPPHGRLVDADKLKNELIEHGHPDTREWYYAEVDQFIDEAPTIVEASK